MWPILWEWGPAVLQTYSVAMSLAFFAGMGLWIYETRPLAIPVEKIVNLALGTFLIGLVGARVLFILTQWPRVLSGDLKPWAVWEGGLVFLGSVISASIFLVLRARRVQIPLRILFDTLMPGLAIAHAVGRLGCLANGCCHGSFCPYPWAVIYTNPMASARPLMTPLHPTQLYESFGLVLLAWGLARLNRRSPLFTQRFSTFQAYLVGYGLLRFFIEFYRGDAVRGFWLFFSTSQWLSLVMIGLAILLDFMRRAVHNVRNEKRS